MLRVIDAAPDVNTYWGTFSHQGPDLVVECGCGRRMHRHGRYLRRVRAKVDEEYRVIPIYRRLCPACGATCSLLPHFLRPYSPYPLPVQEHALRMYVEALHSMEGVAEGCGLEIRTLRRWLARLLDNWALLTGWLARRILEICPLVDLVRGPFRSARDRLRYLVEIMELFREVLDLPPGPLLPVINLGYPGGW